MDKSETEGLAGLFAAWDVSLTWAEGEFTEALGDPTIEPAGPEPAPAVGVAAALAAVPEPAPDPVAAVGAAPAPGSTPEPAAGPPAAPAFFACA